MSAAGRRGFTLVEATVALTIAGALVIMVGTTFLVQNEFYSWINLRSEVQENARAMTELVSSEVRSVPIGGVVLADSLRLVVRSPMANAFVCGTPTGFQVYAHVPGGMASLETGDVGSLGVLNISNGNWDFYDTNWASLTSSGGTPAGTCANNGADTAGVSAEFLRLKFFTVTGTVPSLGNVMQIGRKTEFRIATSALSSGLTALYRGGYGGTLTEFATGLGSTAHFEYRYGSTTYYKRVTGGNLALIDGIRIVAQSTGQGESGAQSQYSFGWTVDVPLPNAR